MTTITTYDKAHVKFLIAKQGVMCIALKIIYTFFSRIRFHTEVTVKQTLNKLQNA